MNITKIIAEELQVKETQVDSTLKLIDEGNKGLLFFVKWLCVQYYRKLFKKVE